MKGPTEQSTKKGGEGLVKDVTQEEALLARKNFALGTAQHCEHNNP